MGFVQEPPHLVNTWRSDHVLRAHLARILPFEVRSVMDPELDDAGALAAGTLPALADRAEAEPPRLVTHDAWGTRVDRIEVSQAWEELHAHSVRLGLCAVPYEDRHGPWRRVVQHALVHLYAPSSAVYSCPVAMTDAAARVLTDHAEPDVRDRVVPRLTSRMVDRAWTSGQWMTELIGGSDISGTETVARRDETGRWRLHGVKWFTSATTADCALVLARPEGAQPGSPGLGLFLVERVDPDDGLAQVGHTIRVLRLKDKLGTRALPTAELALEGAAATPIALSGGLRAISGMLNITRMHNAWNAAAGMRRAVALAVDYAGRRRAFGRNLRDLPLHRRTLAELAVGAEGALALTLDLSTVMGTVEAGGASAAERLRLRLLTPVAKLVTAKDAVAVASEALECFGGAGYVEDTGLPRLLRDAQVLPIWEGTTNVLALDALRVIAREPDALPAVLGDLRDRLQRVSTVPGTGSGWKPAMAACEELADEAASWDALSSDEVELRMRAFTMRVGRTWAATALWDHAAYVVQQPAGATADRDRAVTVAGRYTARWLDCPLTPPVDHDVSATLLE